MLVISILEGGGAGMVLKSVCMNSYQVSDQLPPMGEGQRLVVGITRLCNRKLVCHDAFRRARVLLCGFVFAIGIYVHRLRQT